MVWNWKVFKCEVAFSRRALRPTAPFHSSVDSERLRHIPEWDYCVLYRSHCHCHPGDCMLPESQESQKHGLYSQWKVIHNNVSFPEPLSIQFFWLFAIFSFDNKTPKAFCSVECTSSHHKCLEWLWADEKCKGVSCSNFQPSTFSEEKWRCWWRGWSQPE